MVFPYLKYNKLLEQVFLNDRMFGIKIEWENSGMANVKWFI